MDLSCFNPPEYFLPTLALWGIITFIAWYFYHYSEKKNKTAYLIINTVLLVFLCVVLAYLWKKNSPQFTPTKIAIFPFIKSDSSEKVTWESLAFSEIPAAYLNQVNDQNYITLSFDDLSSAINWDSLNYEYYLKDLSERIKLDYAVYGEFKKNQGSYEIKYDLYNVDENQLVDNSSIVLKKDELRNVGAKIGSDIENALQINSFREQQNLFMTNEAVQLYFRAKVSFLMKKLNAAIELVRKSVESDSTFIEALNLLAKFLIEKASNQQDARKSIDGFVAAKRLLEKSIAVDPKYFRTNQLMGELYLANKKWNQAEAFLRNSLELDPRNSKTYLLLTQLHIDRLGDLGYKDEKKLLERSISLNPGNLDAYFALSNYYKTKNRFDLAKKTVGKALRINPDHIPTLMASGKLHIEQNNLLNIFETFEKVIKLDKDNSHAYYNLGIAYYNQRDFETARQFFETAINLDNHLDSHLYLAYIYELEGEMDKAVDHLRIRIKDKREDDLYYEEARKQLFKIMKERGVIDSLLTSER